MAATTSHETTPPTSPTGNEAEPVAANSHPNLWQALGTKAQQLVDWARLGRWLEMSNDNMQTPADSAEQLLARETELMLEIRALANEVRSKFWPEGTFPIDPETITNRLGYLLKRGPFNKPDLKPDDPNWISGSLRKESGNPRPSISIESRDELERQTFTLAHEIGHYQIITDNMTDQEKLNLMIAEIRRPNRNNASDPHEHPADLFAHLLLMPGATIMSWTADGCTPEEMARRFGVSSESMSNRLQQMAYTMI